jgi:phosphatidylserine/phosphatidylglycerophosphate/cardiolipin synthase-like enzyme
MAKRSSRSSSKKSSGRSFIGTLLGIVVLVVVAIIAQVTGIDLSEVFTGTPIATSVDAPATTAPTTGTQVAGAPGAVSPISVQQGFGAQKGFWQVYFTAPTGSRNTRDYVGGIENQLAAAINQVQRTLDIAAFEFNTPVLTKAVLDAEARGVRVRMVTDDEHGLEDEDSTIEQLTDAGIPVVDDSRSALMHNKFMILDGTVVWTGSWNYTMNDTYRNNNHALVLRSQRAVQNYQTEFDEMFTNKQFGPQSPANTPNQRFSQDGTPIQIYFASEDATISAIDDALKSAQRSIRFMTFSFTVGEIAEIIQDRAENGVNVQGIFETTGSETEFSELTPLFCAGLDVRQDGNSFILHHKVFIIDEQIVVSGSFNISENATRRNDENLIIIQDRDLAAQFVQEFNRRWAEAKTPDGIQCS